MQLSEIGAILVLYQCAPANSITLQSLNRACQKVGHTLPVYIYDNSPNPVQRPEFSNIRIMEARHNPDNPGVSTAYNFFAEKLRHSYKWLLLLDQDTGFPETYFEELKEVDPKNAELILPKLMQGNTLISPHAFRSGYSHSIEIPAKGFHNLQNRAALNSGILVSTHALHRAGGYAEDVPLYFSDQVFIQRLKEHGVSRYFLLNAQCSHSMSSNDERNLADFKKRYQLFVDGARCARRHFPIPTSLGLRALVLMRGFKLSLRHRDSYFLKHALI